MTRTPDDMRNDVEKHLREIMRKMRPHLDEKHRDEICDLSVAAAMAAFDAIENKILLSSTSYVSHCVAACTTAIMGDVMTASMRAQERAAVVRRAFK